MCPEGSRIKTLGISWNGVASVERALMVCNHLDEELHAPWGVAIRIVVVLSGPGFAKSPAAA